jgi:hypothetical protein
MECFSFEANDPGQESGQHDMKQDDDFIIHKLLISRKKTGYS